jgi:hypothetical protein
MSKKSFARLILAWSRRIVLLVLLLGLMGASTASLAAERQSARRFTRPYEFDFVGWTLAAAGIKLEGWSVRLQDYLAQDDRLSLVSGFLDLVNEAASLEGQLEQVYSDPAIADPAQAAAGLLAALQAVRKQQDQQQVTVEAILGEQVSSLLVELGVDVAGTAFPPVSFRLSRIPMALIVSPRSIIRQDANIMLNPGLRVDEQDAMERKVESALDVSALVVPIGGVGTYPTMIQYTDALAWLVETIVHEWVHNYLTLHPLGFNYGASPEMRTMNETTASILGREIGRMVLARYYPAFVPPPPAAVSGEASPAPSTPEPPAFDFRAEMHQTRVTVDSMLEAGQIEEAEAYMEARRQVFWEHGYHLRKLNQAYFAFYGAYADEPGGAAGEDPVGDAVRSFWQLLNSPADFLRQMARMRSFSDLEEALYSQAATH